MNKIILVLVLLAVLLLVGCTTKCPEIPPCPQCPQCPVCEPVIIRECSRNDTDTAHLLELTSRVEEYKHNNTACSMEGAYEDMYEDCEDDLDDYKDDLDDYKDDLEECEDDLNECEG